MELIELRLSRPMAPLTPRGDLSEDMFFFFFFFFLGLNFSLRVCGGGVESFGLLFDLYVCMYIEYIYIQEYSVVLFDIGVISLKLTKLVIFLEVFV